MVVYLLVEEVGYVSVRQSERQREGEVLRSVPQVEGEGLS